MPSSDSLTVGIVKMSSWMRLLERRRMGAAFDHSAYCRFVELQILADTGAVPRAIPFATSTVRQL